MFVTLCWSFLCGGGGDARAGQRISLSVLARNTQTKGLRARSPARPEVDEERKVPEKTVDFACREVVVIAEGLHRRTERVEYSSSECHIASLKSN